MTQSRGHLSRYADSIIAAATIKALTHQVRGSIGPMCVVLTVTAAIVVQSSKAAYGALRVGVHFRLRQSSMAPTTGLSRKVRVSRKNRREISEGSIAVIAKILKVNKIYPNRLRVFAFNN